MQVKLQSIINAYVLNITTYSIMSEYSHMAGNIIFDKCQDINNLPHKTHQEVL